MTKHFIIIMKIIYEKSYVGTVNLINCGQFYLMRLLIYLRKKNKKDRFLKDQSSSEIMLGVLVVYFLFNFMEIIF
jgi:hypothetical protein